MLELTILIPALNEEATIAIVIKKAKKWLKENKVDGEVLIINNGSVDKTKEIAISQGARVVDCAQKGYGNALIAGINAADGKYVIMGDADDSYNFLEIGEMYKKLKDGYDFVIGNRFHHIEKGAMKFLHRYIGTPLLSFMIRKKYDIKINDINCGLRGIRKEKFANLPFKSTGMEFASEMIIQARKLNYKMAEVPIHFYKDKRNKPSHLNTIRDGIRHVKVIFSL